MKFDQARAEDFDALLLPGGVLNPDSLRMQPEAVKFVKAFFDAGKKVAAICHGQWSIIEADVVKGRRIASWPSLKTDLRRGGMGRRRGRGGREPDLEPQAGGSSRLQLRDGRAVCPPPAGGRNRGPQRGAGAADDVIRGRSRSFTGLMLPCKR
ncbi:MAG: DJ-1/PfpI family protein [Rhodoplanes sp.]